MAEEINLASLETLRNSNVHLECMGLKEAVFEGLKASNDNKVEYVPFIPHFLTNFNKQSK